MRDRQIGAALALVKCLRETLETTEDKKNLDAVEREIRTNADARFWLDVVGQYVTDETIGRIYHHAIAA